MTARLERLADARAQSVSRGLLAPASLELSRRIAGLAGVVREVDVPRRRIGDDERQTHRIADVQSAFASDDATFDRRTQQTRVRSLRRRRRHDGREALADSLGEHRRAGDLAHRALDLARRDAALRAATRDLREIVVRIRRRKIRLDRVQHPLRHQIGEPTIGCRRVHVVGDRQAEMSRPPTIAKSLLEHVDARAEQLHDGQRQIREVLRIGRATA